MTSVPYGTNEWWRSGKRFCVCTYHMPCLFGSDERCQVMVMHASWLMHCPLLRPQLLPRTHSCYSAPALNAHPRTPTRTRTHTQIHSCYSAPALKGFLFVKGYSAPALKVFRSLSSSHSIISLILPHAHHIHAPPPSHLMFFFSLSPTCKHTPVRILSW